MGSSGCTESVTTKFTFTLLLLAILRFYCLKGLLRLVCAYFVTLCCCWKYLNSLWELCDMGHSVVCTKKYIYFHVLSIVYASVHCSDLVST